MTGRKEEGEEDEVVFTLENPRGGGCLSGVFTSESKWWDGRVSVCFVSLRNKYHHALVKQIMRSCVGPGGKRAA